MEERHSVSESLQRTASRMMSFITDAAKLVLKVETGSQVLNFLWLGLDLPAKPDPEDGSIRTPLPEEYIENVREAGKRHPRAEINLWVDSKRLTERQMAYLQCVLEEDAPNVHLKDLRSIPEYDSEELYNRAETDKNWRNSYSDRTIWLQVDTAKILISLQGNFDQHFFADLDHAHVDIESRKVQKMIHKHGLMIGSSAADYVCMENQLWGFDRRRRYFFDECYQQAVKDAYNGELGYSTLYRKVSRELVSGNYGVDEGKERKCEKIPEKEFVLPIGSKGLAHAVQPGHEWSGVDTYRQSSAAQRSQIPQQEISSVFGRRASRASVPAAEAAEVKQAALQPQLNAVAALETGGP